MHLYNSLLLKKSALIAVDLVTGVTVTTQLATLRAKHWIDFSKHVIQNHGQQNN